MSVSLSDRDRRYSVLIVEDVDAMRGLLVQFVNGLSDFRVSGEVGNGGQARLELTRRRPDLILLDEVLPGESGWDLLKEFRTQGLPVLLLTGLEDPTHPLPNGAAGRLVKPAWKATEQDRMRFREAMLAALQGR